MILYWLWLPFSCVVLSYAAVEQKPALPVATWSIAPFVLLLLGIAVLPLAAPRFWHSNRNRAFFTAVLALPTVLYLLFLGGPAIAALLHAFEEYADFILLLGALYTICGGIVIRMKPLPTARTNTSLLALGAVLSNFIGTTGVAMVLIRPYLRINRERLHKRHLAVFFIFIICNVGGILTPLGDPPLFLGFLRRVDFFWTLHLWPQWLIANGSLLLLFFVWDTWACRREPRKVFERQVENSERFRVDGLQNLLFLGGVIGAVLLISPTVGQSLAKLVSVIVPCQDLSLPKPVPEIIVGLMLLSSWYWTPRQLRAENNFTWAPILEVAILFLGIFITMVPALALLEQNSKQLGLQTPWQYFWATGLLSSFLDNAPTYLTFATVAAGEGAASFHALSQEQPLLLAAISCGAVFMGANTYIGNGPNFMVKAICDENKMSCPTFFGYMGYACLVLLPLWGLMTWVFFVK